MGVHVELSSTECKELGDNVDTEQAQALRRKAANGKTVLFVSGSYLYPSLGGNLKEHIREIIGLGVTIYMVFQKDKKNDRYYLDAKVANCFHHELFADLSSDSAPENIANVARGTGIVFDGVYTPHEATQFMVSRVQTLLGTCGNDPRAYEIARDKYATRKALEQANLNTAKACQIWTIEDITKAEEVVGFPMIIKPTIGMGSAGVFKVESSQELHDIVTRLFEDLKTNWALAQNTNGHQAPMLAETFISPVRFGKEDLVSEFDVDCLFWDGELQYANVVDNWHPQPPYFQDRGFHAPSLIPQNVQKELIDYCAAAVKALGFTRGSFHMEAWYTPTGPVLIECNPRVGGGSIDKIHRKIWGVSPMLNMFLSFLDIPINPPREITPVCAYGFLLVNAQTSGVVQNSDYLDAIQGNEFVVDSCAFKKQGDSVVGIDKSVPEWICSVDFEAKPKAVDRMVEEMHKVMDKVNENLIVG